MSLLATLSISSNALAVEQAALQTTSTNIANASNADYSRERVDTNPTPDVQVQPGIFLGTGVQLTAIQRQVDEALNDRLRAATSDNAAAATTSQWAGQVQSALGALSGNDLSTQLTAFFNTWSDVANNPTDDGQRQVTIQAGTNVASYLNKLSNQLGTMQAAVNTSLPQQVQTADALADRIAKLNVQIVTQQGATGGTANALSDERDKDLKQLSQLMNISVKMQDNGSATVFVGSDPLVEGQNNYGLKLSSLPDADGTVVPTVVFDDKTAGRVPITSGQIGALQGTRAQIATVQGEVNAIAKRVISSVNDLHASGQGATGFATVTGTNAVNDATAALNTDAAGLDYPPTNGSFVVHVTGTDGSSTSTLVSVTAKGGAGDTTMNSLVASLNGVPGVAASVVNGKLKVSAATTGQTISFSQDSSHVLAGLGVNTFFTGSTAQDIAVNATLLADSSKLAAAKNGSGGDNGTALAIAALETTPPADGSSSPLTLQTQYQQLVTTVADRVATAKGQATAAAAVSDTLTGQQQAVGGVSLDEEMVNMLQQQQAFQASSRVVATVNQMMQSLLAMV